MSTRPPSPRILLVEDNPDDALLLQIEIRRHIRDAHFACVEAEADFREALASSDWDLVLCDHRMPRFDSVRALAVLRECRPDTPFVICSGDLDESVALSAMRIGAEDFVRKPDWAHLIPVVERELRNARLRRAKREADVSLAMLSHYDPLTRLPNRQALLHVAERRLAEPGAAQAKPALLVLDIDRFTRLNDSFGFGSGDDLLKQVAVRLQLCAGVSASIARLGQDEFGVFLASSTGPVTGGELAERIQRAFSQAITLGRREIYVTFSMGLAFAPDHGEEADALLKNAESAMSSGKRRGGNRLQVYNRAFTDLAEHHLLVENALRDAIDRGQLSLVYQPIFDLRTGHVIATEALARWRHPQFGVIMPDEFIPLAEQSGQIGRVGEWVMNTAALQTRRWRNNGFHALKVAVNVSAGQFHGGHVVESVRKTLSRSGLPAEALEIEITETVAMTDTTTTTKTLQALSALGVQLALDDFGTGYSSLAQLRRLPIDILKVDRSFVQGLPEDEDGAAIVRMIAALSRSLGLTLHAEGIETAGQQEFLRRHRCQRAQGYHLSPPLAAEEVPSFLAANAKHRRSRFRPPKISRIRQADYKPAIASAQAATASVS